MCIHLGFFFQLRTQINHGVIRPCLQTHARSCVPGLCHFLPISPIPYKKECGCGFTVSSIQLQGSLDVGPPWFKNQKREHSAAFIVLQFSSPWQSKS